MTAAAPNSALLPRPKPLPPRIDLTPGKPHHSALRSIAWRPHTMTEPYAGAWRDLVVNGYAYETDIGGLHRRYTVTAAGRRAWNLAVERHGVGEAVPMDLEREAEAEFEADARGENDDERPW
jgi:hypothetical protein